MSDTIKKLRLFNRLRKLGNDREGPLSKLLSKVQEDKTTTARMEGLRANRIRAASELDNQKVSVKNLLRLKVQMGNEFIAEQGWMRVDFPEPMISAHVVAVSGPKSAKIPSEEIRRARRDRYIVKMAAATNKLMDKAMDILMASVPEEVRGVLDDLGSVWGDIEGAISQAGKDFADLISFADPLLGPLTGVVDDIVGLFTGVSLPNPVDLLFAYVRIMMIVYTEILWDEILEPLMREMVNDNLPVDDLWSKAESWGIERGRAVHAIDLREISGTGFEWHSSGDVAINWIAVGLTEEEVEIPEEIQVVLDDLKAEVKDLRKIFQEDLEVFLRDIKDQFTGVDVPDFTP